MKEEDSKKDAKDGSKKCKSRKPLYRILVDKLEPDEVTYEGNHHGLIEEEAMT
jgi:hypothetical protein